MGYSRLSCWHSIWNGQYWAAECHTRHRLRLMKALLMEWPSGWSVGLGGWVGGWGGGVAGPVAPLALPFIRQREPSSFSHPLVALHFCVVVVFPRFLFFSLHPPPTFLFFGFFSLFFCYWFPLNPPTHTQPVWRRGRNTSAQKVKIKIKRSKKVKKKFRSVLEQMVRSSADRRQPPPCPRFLIKRPLFTQLPNSPVALFTHAIIR